MSVDLQRGKRCHEPGPRRRNCAAADRWPTRIFTGSATRGRRRGARRWAARDFVRARQLLATGAWRGPRDAAESFVDEGDLGGVGGWEAARALGASAGRRARSAAARAAVAGGARSIWRLHFRSGEDRDARVARSGPSRARGRRLRPGA